MLHTYVQLLTTHQVEPLIDIINNDVDFNAAVQKYKNLVTHYLGSKIDIWFALFMKPVHGVDGSVLSFEKNLLLAQMMQ